MHLTRLLIILIHKMKWHIKMNLFSFVKPRDKQVSWWIIVWHFQNYWGWTNVISFVLAFTETYIILHFASCAEYILSIYEHWFAQVYFYLTDLLLSTIVSNSQLQWLYLVIPSRKRLDTELEMLSGIIIKRMKIPYTSHCVHGT